MGRPAGSRNKLPTRAWLLDQFQSRNFNAIDELVDLYRSSPPEIKVKLITMVWEFLFPKAKPEDANGDDSTPEMPVFVAVTNENMAQMLKLARGDK